MHFVRAILSVVFVVCVAATASADTVRVIVERALVWTQPSGVSIVMSQLLKDQTAEVVRRVGDWYEIVAPPGSGGGDRQTGFISASQVVLDSVGPPKQPAAARGREPARTTTARTTPAGIVHVDAVYRAGVRDLTRTTTAFADRFAEEGSITTNYGNRSGPAFGVLVGYSLAGPIGIGGALDYYNRKRPAAVEGHVPHPFFFNQLRTGTFEADGLEAREAAIHIPVLWTLPPVGALKILVYAGPTIFRVSQTVVTDLKLNEQYPYDTVSIVGVTTAERKSTLIGFHAGGDVSYFFTPTIGVGGGVRYSHATMKFDNDGSATTTGVAGAVEVAAGLRVKF